jgi:hypothetical protein
MVYFSTESFQSGFALAVPVSDKIKNRKERKE